MESNTRIYIVTHKKFAFPKLEGYIPIEAGASLHKSNLDLLRDDIGDNISNKNPNYCELTAHYWVWKNARIDIVGICHYRRYFSKYFLNYSEKYLVSLDQIKKELLASDIILPCRFFWLKHNVATGYYEAGKGRKRDLSITVNVIKEMFPEYTKDLFYVLDSRSASYCNMLICKKELFDNYCEWLFAILSEVEKRIDLSTYTTAEARVFGYLSEILLNVWVRHKKLKVKYMPVVVNKPLSKRRRIFAYIEKVPILGILSRILLCSDIAYITNKKK